MQKNINGVGWGKCSGASSICLYLFPGIIQSKVGDMSPVVCRRKPSVGVIATSVPRTAGQSCCFWTGSSAARLNLPGTGGPGAF